MKSKLPYILEITWLLVLLGSLIAAVVRTIQVNFSESIMLYVVAGLATLMYSSRRYVRKTREKTQAK